MKKWLASVICTCLLLISAPLALSSNAVTSTCDTYDGHNVESQNYWNYSSTVNSYLTKSISGGLMRVQGDAIDGKILIEYYDDSYNFLSSKMINAELPIFGAFYETDSNYYILSGQTNYEESNSVEVYRITKYDKKWNRFASCGLYGANTYIPFSAGSARITVDGKYLLIRTCHEMYKTDDGFHHQANVTIQVDINSMKITDSYTDIMNMSYGYVSHSFNQFIKTEDGHIVAVDHGDDYPRSIVLTKYSTDFTTGSFTPNWGSTCSVTNLLSFPGNSGYNYTGASVGGFEITESSYLVVGNYVGDSNFHNTSAARNIFTATLSRSSNGTTEPKINFITSYTSGTTSTPQLVKIASNKYMLLWSRDSKVYYTEIDGRGEQLGSIYSMDGALSDCVPLVYDGKLIWYTWDYDIVTFYNIDTLSLSSNSKTIIENGHKFNSSIKTEENIVILSCSECGYTKQIIIPTDFSMWWRQNSDYGYYYSFCSSTYNVGDTLDVWADITQTVDDYNMTFEISDTSIASVSEESSSKIRITMKKNGKFTLKVYPRYNKSIAKTYTFTVESTTSDYDLGDVNMSGSVTIDDATLIQKYLAEMNDLTAEQLNLADTDSNGKIEINDVTQIQKYLAGMIGILG